MNAIPGSVLADARKARERLTKPRERDFDLPGYDGIFKARYSPLSWNKTRELIETRENYGADGNADVWYGANSLMEECKCILAKVDDEWVEAYPGYQDLAEALEVELPHNPQPHDAVYGVFGGLSNGADRLVMAHHLEVLAWTDSLEADATEVVLPNSGSAG